jgi:hypothetical protein
MDCTDFQRLPRKAQKHRYKVFFGIGVAQWVYCLPTDWTAGVRSPAEATDFSSSLCIQTSSEAQPASYLMGTGGSYSKSKARPGRDADHSPRLVPSQ